MKHLAVIPSRLGTKDKGMWLLRNQPLVWWAIQACQLAGVETLVSTDSPGVVAIAEQEKVRWRGRRGALRDNGPIEPVLLDAIRDRDVDVVHCVQPTSPFVTPDDIRWAAAALDGRSKIAGAQTITPLPHNHHPINARRIVDAQSVAFVEPVLRRACRTKEDKSAKYAFGTLVSIRRSELERTQFVFAAECAWRLVDPAWRALDVDTLEDLALANLIAENWL